MHRSNVFHLAAAGSIALLVTMTAGAGDGSPEWQPVAYVCESGQPLTVSYRQSGTAVQVTVPAKKAVRLVARPADAGFRFSDSRHELRGDGEAITWQVDSRTPVKCTSEDPAAAKLAAVAIR